MIVSNGQLLSIQFHANILQRCLCPCVTKDQICTLLNIRREENETLGFRFSSISFLKSHPQVSNAQFLWVCFGEILKRNSVGQRAL